MKKKASKQKQKQRQKQSQQVVINIGSTRQQRREKRQHPPPQPMSVQPPPVVQYLYRDNLALNMLNDRTRTAQQQQQHVATVAPAPPAVAAPAQQAVQPPQPPPPRATAVRVQEPATPPPVAANQVARILQNNTIHKSTSIPTNKQPIQKQVATDFEKVINPKYPSSANNNDEQPLRNFTSPLSNIAENQKDIPQAIRMTNKGLPYRRTREEKLAYNQYMEEVVANKPAEKRSKEEAKAYNEYINSLQKQSANDTSQGDGGLVQQSMDTFVRQPVTRKPMKILPVDFEDTMDEADSGVADDEEGLTFFSPLKKKPS